MCFEKLLLWWLFETHVASGRIYRGWMPVRLGFDSRVEDLPSAVAVFEGERVDFFVLVAAPGFLAAVGFYFGVFVPFVVGFQVVGLMVVGLGYASGFEVFDAVDDPSAALVERLYFLVDFEFSVV